MKKPIICEYRLGPQTIPRNYLAPEHNGKYAAVKNVRIGRGRVFLYKDVPVFIQVPADGKSCPRLPRTPQTIYANDFQRRKKR